MLLYDKQSENDSDLKDITEYNHISIRIVQFFTKLNIAIFKGIGEGLKNLWYLYKALNELCAGHPGL